MAKLVKNRNWVQIIYVDSAPIDWQEQIEAMHVSCLVSPLHDMDILPDGTLKKPHYHAVFMFDGPITLSCARERFSFLNGPTPIECYSPRGAIRYFTHMDSPDKYQYSPVGILSFAGADYKEYVTLTAGEESKILRDLRTFIRDNNIYNISVLYDILDSQQSKQSYDWLYVMDFKRSLAIKTYIDGRYQLYQKGLLK